ncbi:MAG: DUF2281 domain-containing protein [Kiritimatiellaeota bacterium]|nr:DUF2281 domain-containing protein [Kiritimatiellota bacterium]
MTTTALLVKELESLPEAIAEEVLDFVLFLRTTKTATGVKLPQAKSMFGVFPGIRTDIEREEDNRV